MGLGENRMHYEADCEVGVGAVNQRLLSGGPSTAFVSAKRICISLAMSTPSFSDV